MALPLRLRPIYERESEEPISDEHAEAFKDRLASPVFLQFTLSTSITHRFTQDCTIFCPIISLIATIDPVSHDFILLTLSIYSLPPSSSRRHSPLRHPHYRTLLLSLPYAITAHCSLDNGWPVYVTPNALITVSLD